MDLLLHTMQIHPGAKSRSHTLPLRPRYYSRVSPHANNQWHLWAIEPSAYRAQLQTAAKLLLLSEVYSCKGKSDILYYPQFRRTIRVVALVTSGLPLCRPCAERL